MMTCRTVEHALVDYLDGALSGQARRDVDAHLARCQHCQALLADEQAISERLQQLPRRSCPEKVLNAIFDEVEHTRSPTTWKTWFQWPAFAHPWQVGLAGAALIFCLVVGTGFLGGDLSSLHALKTGVQELEDLRQDLVVTIAYVQHYLNQPNAILEDQLTSVQAAVQQPVQRTLTQHLASARQMIRQSVETGVRDTLRSIFDGGLL